MPTPAGAMFREATAEDVRAGRPRRIPFPTDGVNVLVILPDDHASGAALVRDLDADRRRFANWGITIRVVLADDHRPLPSWLASREVQVLRDDEGQVHRSAGVEPGDGALLVLDVYGQVYFSRDLDEDALPTVDELFREARFPALQCPECETPDVPSASVLPP